MTIEKTMLAMLGCALAVACNRADAGGGGGGDGQFIAGLPRLTRGHVAYPYTRYREATAQTASHGRVFFLYPIKERKNEILALEYAPGIKVEELFGEDLLGTGGAVVADKDRIAIDFLPIAIPLGVAAGQEWTVRYAKRDFVCRSYPGSGADGGIAVSCASGKYILSYAFDRTRGVTRFQDFCDFSICTFELMDSQGLLSKAMTQSMGLPGI